MKAEMNFMIFSELKFGEKFITIYTGDRAERENLNEQKEVLIKTAQLPIGVYSDNSINLNTGEKTHVAQNTPVIRIK